MLLHRLNEAFPALCTGPESPDESFFVYASRLSGELMRLREHPVRHIAFPFCCPLDFLLLFPRERRHALLAETLCFGDWLYAAAVRLYRHFSALRTVRSAEVFDAERSAWKHNPLFCTFVQRNVVYTSSGSSYCQQIARKIHLVHVVASENNTVCFCDVFYDCVVVCQTCQTNR